MFPYTTHVETVVLLSHKDADGFIEVKMDYEGNVERIPERVTYAMIQEYVEDKYGFKVHTAYIAEVKRSLGLEMYDAPNRVEELKLTSVRNLIKFRVGPVLFARLFVDYLYPSRSEYLRY